ncbi:MAG: SanA/YdcF family protein [Acutalibacteraceae bacterium]|jgi:SanA protein
MAKKDRPIKEKKRPSRRRWLRRGLLALGLLLLPALVADRYVVVRGGQDILPIEQAAERPADAIVVFGALVRDDGTPCEMLEDRVKTAVSLYKAGGGKVLVLSGDGADPGYDEPAAMKRCALELGVPEEAIVLDRAGMSTYETLWRAQAVGRYRRVTVVTQTYHLYRALYIAQRLGLEAVGVSADLRSYGGKTKREVREILARGKDLAQCVALPEPSTAPLPYQKN